MYANDTTLNPNLLLMQEEVFLTIARMAALEAAKSEGMQPHLKDLPFGATCMKVNALQLVSGRCCTLLTCLLALRVI